MEALDQRIAGVRRELNEAQTVRAELVHDMAYVAGRLAGEPIDELLEQRRSLVEAGARGPQDQRLNGVYRRRRRQCGSTPGGVTLARKKSMNWRTLAGTWCVFGNTA